MAGIPNIVTFSICLARFWRAEPDRLDVLLEERRVERLAGHDLADPAVHLERPDRGDHDGRIRAQAGRPALDVEELLGAHVGPEAGLRADDVVGHERQPVGDDRVVAVGDVGERPGVDEGRPALERLEQVRLDRVAQQDGHRAGDAEVLGGDRRPVDVVARTIRPSRARRSKRSVARARTAMTSEPTVMTNSVSRGTPSSRPPRPMTTCRSARSLMSTTRGQRIPCGSMPERVLVVEAVVEEGGGEVVRRADGVDVAGQVEVEVLHRDDLAVAAAGGAALDPEDRAE